MQPEKWNQIKGRIKDNFPVREEGVQRLEDEGGVDIEYIEFSGPLGLMRLEYVSKPVVLDKKTVYSKRIGSETKVDYVYSETERSHQMTAYKWDDSQEDWLEMDGAMFGGD